MCLRDRWEIAKRYHPAMQSVLEANADLERVLVIDDRDTPLTLSLIHI